MPKKLSSSLLIAAPGNAEVLCPVRDQRGDWQSFDGPRHDGVALH